MNSSFISFNPTLMPQQTKLQFRSVPFPAELLASSQHGRRYRSELWLYLILRALASPRSGRLQVDPAKLASFLGRLPETILSQLGRLRAAGYIDLRREHNLVHIQLRHWTPDIEPHQEDPDDSDEVSQTLAQQIALALEDQNNLGRYEELCEHYPEAIVKRAFRDAAAMPQERIRKSRGALFTYLLKNYYAQAQDQD